MAPPLFPTLPGITYPVRRSIKWANTKHDSLSGKRVRTSYYTYPIYAYELTFNFLRTGTAFLEWQQLAGFINQLAGGTGMFLYDDINDDASPSNQVFGVGDGATTTFRLVRSLGSFVEPIFFPKTPIPTVRVNGVPTAAYTFDATNNVVFTSAPPNGQNVDWTGGFYWPCRFDNDPFDFDNFASQFFEFKGLKFSSEKLV
jgi:uncharacterized protein (TIGR02217 family)